MLFRVRCGARQTVKLVLHKTGHPPYPTKVKSWNCVLPETDARSMLERRNRKIPIKKKIGARDTEESLWVKKEGKGLAKQMYWESSRVIVPRVTIC